ncbi:hypothetical protein F5B22DRAFT_544619 [Xylaria bambusicola]|uniref:uncharacterized protein n=1 Tax=Xylaria bambusicola TaxID=326684 RepID=UPI002007B7BE|nr:uncharacterized protein F5B22DRAFT_544619 [Xylaria bambusicola]KAI0521600.1 hypothetical protein F5B22DRAFT_544619 [Xylaria bambusicola]
MAYTEGSFLSNHQGRWNVTKLVLRSISFFIGIIIIGLSAGDGVHILTVGDDYLLDWAYTFPVVFVTFATDAVELGLGFLWKRNPGIRPGWHIGAELVLLGGNVVALYLLSQRFPPDYGWFNGNRIYSTIRSIKAALIAFESILAIDRFILFVMACVDTHIYHTAVQVQMIVQALRQQNANDPTTAGLVNNAMYLEQQGIPTHGYQQMPRPSHEPYPTPEYYRELPDNQKFQGDIRRQLYAT